MSCCSENMCMAMYFCFAVSVYTQDVFHNASLTNLLNKTIYFLDTEQNVIYRAEYNSRTSDIVRLMAVVRLMSGYVCAKTFEAREILVQSDVPTDFKTLYSPLDIQPHSSHFHVYPQKQVQALKLSLFSPAKI